MRRNKTLQKICILIVVSIFVYFFPLQLFPLLKSGMRQFMNSRRLDSPKETFNWSQMPIIAPQEVNRILIVSEARSGSSFLGDLLQQSPLTFYSFEPLIQMKNRHPRIDQKSAAEAYNILNKLYNCDFSNFSKNYLNPVFWKVPYFAWNLVVKKTIGDNKVDLFNASLNEYICRRCRVHVIKVIRFGVNHFIDLNERIREKLSPIKLVFLVRDPRGVMSSRVRMQWCINSPNCTDVDVLCDRMRSDISAIKELAKWSPGVFTIVRYEDLSLDPYNYTKRLYSLLKLPFTSSVERWIEGHTKHADILANPHSTRRNSKESVFTWTSRLDPMEIADIQNSCMDIMIELGYKLLDIDYDYDNNNNTHIENLSQQDLIENIYPLIYLSP